MFDYCDIVKKKCSFCTKTNEKKERWSEGEEKFSYCGIKYGNNRIDLMGSCPKEKKEKKQTYYKRDRYRKF